MKFKSSLLLDDFGLIYDYPSEEYEGRVARVEDSLISSSKRGELRQIVFKFDEKYYRGLYLQDNISGCSWNDLEEIECDEVVPEEYKAIRYVTI